MCCASPSENIYQQKRFNFLFYFPASYPFLHSNQVTLWDMTLNRVPKVILFHTAMKPFFPNCNSADWNTLIFLIIISRRKFKIEYKSNCHHLIDLLDEATLQELNLLAMEMKLLSQPNTTTNNRRTSKNRMFVRFYLAEILWGRRPWILVGHKKDSVGDCYLPPATRVPSGFHKYFASHWFQPLEHRNQGNMLFKCSSDFKFLAAKHSFTHTHAPN